MQSEFDEMIDKLETGAFVYVEPSRVRTHKFA